MYASHVLEHLNGLTVNRVLSETRRVMRESGRLIIKIPDFDEALDCWRRNDPSFFADALWNYDAVVPTWANRKIPDRLDYRAAMLFCGFWNDEYGDHFSGRILKNPSAYHGPPVVEFLRNLVADHTPSQISAKLRAHVVAMEKSYHFNHQSAWSREELSNLLAAHGFQVQSFDKASIMSGCTDIPGIESMRDQSVYCWATKAQSSNQISSTER